MDSGREQVSGKKGVTAAAPKAAGAKTAPEKTTAAKNAAAKTAPAAPANKAGAPNINAVLHDASEQRAGLLRKIIMWQALVILVLTATMVYAKFNVSRDPVPFAINTQTAKPKRLVALSGPTQTQQALMSWVGATSADILNFGFHNVIERLDSTRKYFTDEGWDSFVEAVKSSDIISNVSELQQVITAAPTGTPVILRTSAHPIYGRQWIVQVPIFVTVLSGQKTNSRRRTLTLTLVSVPPEQNLTGLGIHRWIDR